MSTMSEKEERPKGWVYPTDASRKAHYFINGTALCRGYFIWKSSDKFLEDDNHDSLDNCKKCNTKRKKLEEEG